MRRVKTYEQRAVLMNEFTSPTNCAPLTELSRRSQPADGMASVPRRYQVHLGTVSIQCLILYLATQLLLVSQLLMPTTIAVLFLSHMSDLGQ